MKIKVNDTVIVIAGKDKNTIAKVVKVSEEKQTVLVEGVNKVKKHVKASTGIVGGIIQKEMPIHVSNVMLICPDTGKMTRVGYRMNAAGKKERISKKSQKPVDTPPTARTNKSV